MKRAIGLSAVSCVLVVFMATDALAHSRGGYCGDPDIVCVVCGDHHRHSYDYDRYDEYYPSDYTTDGQRIELGILIGDLVYHRRSHEQIRWAVSLQYRSWYGYEPRWANGGYDRRPQHRYHRRDGDGYRHRDRGRSRYDGDDSRDRGRRTAYRGNDRNDRGHDHDYDRDRDRDRDRGNGRDGHSRRGNGHKSNRGKYAHR